MNKYCWKCKLEHPIDQFYKNKFSKDGLDQICKTERKKIVKNYNDLNNIARKEYSKNYYHLNKNKYKEYKRVYNKEYTKKRRSIDPAFKIANNLRKRLVSALKGKYKPGSAIKDLGCSIQELKKYLQEKFKPGMTWANYGRGSGFWSIDHIQPLAKFDLQNIEDLKKVNHYSNLQPMWFQENCRKHKK